MMATASAAENSRFALISCGRPVRRARNVVGPVSGAGPASVAGPASGADAAGLAGPAFGSGSPGPSPRPRVSLSMTPTSCGPGSRRGRAAQGIESTNHHMRRGLRLGRPGERAPARDLAMPDEAHLSVRNDIDAALPALQPGPARAGPAGLMISDPAGRRAAKEAVPG